MKTKLYVWDLDGTIANVEHRRYLVQCEQPDYDSFNRSCVTDKPNKWIVDLLNICREHGDILILSGRSKKHDVEGYTRDWLLQNEIMYDFLIMREADDSSADEICKLKMLENFLRDKDYEVQFIVDDRPKVIKMWKENGFNVLDCGNGVDF